MGIRWMAAFLLVCVGTGCGEEAEVRTPPEPIVTFDTAAVRIQTATDTLTMTAEIAETDDQRAYGLMERSALPADRGMLFVYPEAQDSTAGFWMYRTLIPLDIAFLDEDGRILDIQSMRPCESPNPRVCPLYSPGVPFHGALEANQGFFAEHGIAPGDRVIRIVPG